MKHSRAPQQTGSWKIALAIFLAFLAAALYYLRWVFFSTASFHSEMLRFFLGDFAFLFLQVLVVTVFLETYLKRREERAKRQKLNMIIGAFFSETGFELFGDIAHTDAASEMLRISASPQPDWTHKDFEQARAAMSTHVPQIEPTTEQLAEINALLKERKKSLLALLTNQALLDHESFTDLLWSISHLTDELAARHAFDSLPEKDILHLSVDIERTYGILGITWLDYLEHLQDRYPYLYSLAIRNNPLNPHCVVEVR